jgi:hypothetical protein
LNRKSLDDNIYKQWQLGRVMVIRLHIDFGKLEKVALKGVIGKGVGCWGKRFGG